MYRMGMGMGMGRGMLYPYGMITTNPYAYTGMVCFFWYTSLKKFDLTADCWADGMAVWYWILNFWIDNSELFEEGQLWSGIMRCYYCTIGLSLLYDTCELQLWLLSLSIVLCNQISCAKYSAKVTSARSISKHATSLFHILPIDRQLYLTT